MRVPSTALPDGPRYQGVGGFDLVVSAIFWLPEHSGGRSGPTTWGCRYWAAHSEDALR